MPVRKQDDESLIYYLRHQVRHLVAVGAWDDLEYVLLKLRFWEATAEHGMTYGLVDDFLRALGSLPEDRPRYGMLRLMEESLQRHARFIEAHPNALFQCMWNSCCAGGESAAAEQTESSPSHATTEPTSQNALTDDLCQLMEEWRNDKERRTDGFVWLRSLSPSLVPLGGALALRLTGHSESIYALAVSGDGQRLASASYDGTVRVWDARTGREVAEYRFSESRIEAVCFTDNDQVLVACRSGESGFAIRNAETGEDVVRLGNGHATGNMVAFSQNGRHFVLSNSDGFLAVGNTEACSQLRECAILEPPPRRIGISPEGSCVVSVGEDGVLRVWDGASATEMCHLNGVFGVVGLAVSRSGEKIAWAELGGISVLDRTTGTESVPVAWGHPIGPSTLALSRDGQVIASGSMDGVIDVWNVPTRSKLCSFSSGSHPIECLAFSADAGVVYAGSEDTLVCGWDVARLHHTPTTRGHTGRITCLALCAESKRLATGSADATVRLWDFERGDELSCLVGHESVINGLRFIRGGDWLVSYSDDRTLRIWDVATDEQHLRLKGHDRAVTCMDISADEKMIVSGSDDAGLRLWDPRDGEELARLVGHEFAVSSVSFSPDGRLVASGAGDGTVRLWDVYACKELATIMARDSVSLGDHSVRFLPDGHRIVFLWDDDTVRLWDIQLGEETGCSRVPDGAIGLTLSEDGRMAIVNCRSNLIQVWDLDTGLVRDCFPGFCIAQGDVRAISRGPEDYPWRAVPSSLGTSLVPVEGGPPIAWCPAQFLSALPDGRSWVSINGKEAEFFRLEGSPRVPDRPRPAEGPGAGSAPTGPCMDRNTEGPSELVFRRTRWFTKLVRHIRQWHPHFP